MAQISGTVKEWSLGGRTFTPKADTEVSIMLGGFKNEVSRNGNNTSVVQREAEAPGVEGLNAAIDHDRDDLTFLKGIGDGGKFKAFTITLTDDNTYQGSAMPGEQPKYNSKTGYADVALVFDGEITKQ